jgi:hypothetical protein
MRAPILTGIRKHRDEMQSALPSVLQTYLRIKQEQRATPNPIPEFSEHFTMLASLLRAYAAVSEKGEVWAEQIIAEWAAVLGEREPDEDPLEFAILQVLQESGAAALQPMHSVEGHYAAPVIRAEHCVVLGDQPGMLYVTEAAVLLGLLKQSRGFDRDLPLPKGAGALTKRLNGIKPWHRMRYLNDETLKRPENNDVPDSVRKSLRRKGDRKPLGFFVPGQGA